MPVTYTYPYTQYGGIWNLSSQANAKGLGTWPSQPAPTLFSWGSGTGGVLGVGNTTNYSSPKQVGSASTWSKVVNGYNGGATLAVKSDGTLWSWGQGATYGALGLGNTTNYSSPKQVGALTNWSKISVAFQSSAAIKTDGTLWTWGRNDRGQLGQGNTSNYSSPKQVGILTNWLSISGGQYFFTATKTDGTLWSWGYNAQGQLGQSNITNYSSPKQIGALTNWSNFGCIGYAVIASKTDGTLWCWGQNSDGQLGLGNRTSYSSPKQIGALTNWLNATFSANGFGYHVLVIKSNGNLWSWGVNANGQLGLGNTTGYSSPKQVGSLTDWLLVASGGYQSLAIKTNGTLWSWGKNDAGQLGTGNTTYYSSPRQLGSLTSWTALGAAYFDSFGIANT